MVGHERREILARLFVLGKSMFDAFEITVFAVALVSRVGYSLKDIIRSDLDRLGRFTLLSSGGYRSETISWWTIGRHLFPVEFDRLGACTTIYLQFYRLPKTTVESTLPVGSFPVDNEWFPKLCRKVALPSVLLGRLNNPCG